MEKKIKRIGYDTYNLGDTLPLPWTKVKIEKE